MLFNCHGEAAFVRDSWVCCSRWWPGRAQPFTENWEGGGGGQGLSSLIPTLALRMVVRCRVLI